MSSAANTQCVELPTDWPSARDRVGKISLMNTQITAPCPTACEAMNRNRHHGTSLNCPWAKASEHAPSETM